MKNISIYRKTGISHIALFDQLNIYHKLIYQFQLYVIWLQTFLKPYYIYVDLNVAQGLE